MMFVYFILATLASLLLTPGIRALMRRYEITDQPKKDGRMGHKKHVPLGGGLAIFLSFSAITLFALGQGGLPGTLSLAQILGIIAGGAVLMVGGFLDDRYTLKAVVQIWFPILAALIVIATGISPEVFTHPFGGTITLATTLWSFETWGRAILLADFLTFGWLMGMMFTTKFLDGLDGLVTGIVAIGAMMIFFLSRLPAWNHPTIALLSAVFLGACLGFLVWNWHPAKIFLGEGGSLFTGYMLGILAILSGGKIATTLLVVGVPMLDVIRVIVRRLQKKRPIFHGDKEHLHYKLLDAGLSERQTALLFYSLSFLFGMTTLFLQNREKIIALAFLFILMLLTGMWFTKKENKV